MRGLGCPDLSRCTVASTRCSFHDGAALNDQDSLLEGGYPDRRMVYFHSLGDVAAKRPRLESAIREWIEIKDEAAAS